MKLHTIGQLIYIASLASALLIIGVSLHCLGWQFWTMSLCVFCANVSGMLQQMGGIGRE